MSCERFRSALKDAALGRAMDFALEAHVSACPRCRGRLAEHRRAIAALDAGLNTALSVEPSASFQAQVRMHVADAPASAALSLRWIAIGTAVMALILMVVFVGRTPRPASTSTGSEKKTVGARPVEPAAHREAMNRSGDAPLAAALPGGAPAGSRAVRPQLAHAAPDVLVPPDRAEAIRRLVEAVAEGRVQPPRGPDAPGAAAAAQSEIVPLTVQPISLSPLELRETAVPAIDSLEGGHRD